MPNFQQLHEVNNLVAVTVSGSYNASATSITLSSGAGASLPDPSTQNDFYLVWYDATNYTTPFSDPLWEVVKCTARATDVLTVERGADSSTASTKSTGGATYQMLLCNTRQQYEDIDALLSVAINPVASKFGAVFDGATDDSAAVHAAITAASGGQPVIFPAGTCVLSTAWPTAGYNYAKDVRLIGVGKGTVLKGVSTKTFLDISDGISMSGIKFDTWDEVVDLDSITGTVGDVELIGCHATTCSKLISWDTVGGSALVERLRIEGCNGEAFLDRAIEVRGYFDSAKVIGNFIDGAKDQAIRLGDDDATDEAKWKNINVTGNTVSNVTQSAGASSGVDCYGILLYGHHAVVEANNVDGVTSGSGAGSEATGIYLKCRNSNVIGNTVQNVALDTVSGSTSHAWGIEVKGDVRGAVSPTKPAGYGVQVVGNTVEFATAGRSRGIRVANGEVEVLGNFVDGADDHGIQLGADGRDTDFLRCEGNRVRMVAHQDSGDSIGIRCNSIVGPIVADNNTIYGTYDFAVRVNPTAGSIGDISISNNKIQSDNSSAFGVYFNPSSSGAVVDAHVNGNIFTGAFDDIIRTSAIAITNFFAEKNRMNATGTDFNFDTDPTNVYLSHYPPKSGNVSLNGTTVTVTHLHRITPLFYQIQINPRTTDATMRGAFTVTNIGATTFDVEVDTGPASAVTIDWAVV